MEKDRIEFEITERFEKLTEQVKRNFKKHEGFDKMNERQKIVDEFINSELYKGFLEKEFNNYSYKSNEYEIVKNTLQKILSELMAKIILG